MICHILLTYSKFSFAKYQIAVGAVKLCNFMLSIICQKRPNLDKKEHLQNYCGSTVQQWSIKNVECPVIQPISQYTKKHHFLIVKYFKSISRLHHVTRRGMNHTLLYPLIQKCTSINNGSSASIISTLLSEASSSNGCQPFISTFLHIHCAISPFYNQDLSTEGQF
jgi:hypothetical protein